MSENYTLQIHHHGGWQDAATIQFTELNKGIGGRTVTSYEVEYFADFAAAEALDANVIDNRALSLNMPVNVDVYNYDSWPTFLLDLLPQGAARRRLVNAIFGDEGRVDFPDVETPLLLRASGSPIGNIRIKEAWQGERERVKGNDCPGVTEDQILNLDDLFLDVADRFALLASGSSGVQGEWPKVLMSKARDGLWYPDSLVADNQAVEHSIVKMTRSGHRDDALILESEAPYLEVARQFGLRVDAPLRVKNGALIIPRFDREVTEEQDVLRFGQESLVAALGIAQFGYTTSHEKYLEVIKKHTTDPVAELTEYVLRDVLNLAMGNPDNHGRNTALQKRDDGVIRLTPLFDFAPMRIDPGAIRRVTRWACMAHNDSTPDWRLICNTVTGGMMKPDDLYEVLHEKKGFLGKLPGIASDLGVSAEVIDRACYRHNEIADSI